MTRRGWVALTVLGGALGCVEWAGPALGRPGLVIVPLVSPGPGSGGATVLFDDLDRLHVTVTPAVAVIGVGQVARATTVPGGAVVDTTVAVDAAGNAALTVRVPVVGAAQTYQVLLEGFRSSDSVVLYRGSDLVTVRPTGVTPVDSVPVAYVGPCALGAGCAISVGPQGVTLKQGAGSVALTTLVTDVLGSPVPGVPVRLTDVTPGLIGLASDLTVTPLSGTSCGAARVAAEIPGSSDTLRLEVTGPVTIPAVLFAGDSAVGMSSGVFCHNTNATGRFRITSNGTSGDVNPRYSPDRQRVAYTFNPGTQQQLWVARWAGDTDALVVSDTVPAYRPRWSPNGQHLAYQCGSNVCVIADATGPISLLSQTPRAVFAGVPTRSTGSGSFAWDPRNPDRLAFPLDSVYAFDSVTLRQTMTSALYVANFDGTAVTQLTPAPLDAGTGVLQIQEVDWSPPGGVIVFSATDTLLTSKLYAINADGTGFRQLTRGVDSDSHPIVSPDGSQVLFLRNVGGCSIDYWRVRIDGTAEQQVTSEAFCDISTNALGHDWSPDGTEIVLVGAGPNGQYGGFMVYRLPAGTTAATYLKTRLPVRGLDAGSSSNDFQPSWRP